MPQLEKIDFGASELRAESEEGVDVGIFAEVGVRRFAVGRWGEGLEDLLEEVGSAVGCNEERKSVEGQHLIARERSQRNTDTRPSARLRIKSLALLKKMRGMTLVVLQRQKSVPPRRSLLLSPN